ncbi:MAG: PEP-CTERM sorting domain-containing protein [Gammaproteobacteria bacterium]|nr:PEP-CTERM sorting domain-containing protein [Gammaproteobacteria bacterium]
MNKIISKRLIQCAILVVAGGLSYSVSAETAYQWNLANEGSPPCAAPDGSCSDGWDVSRTVEPSTATQPKVGVQGLYLEQKRTREWNKVNGRWYLGGWSNWNTGKLQSGLVNSWTGLGVAASTGTAWDDSPRHAVSNSGVTSGGYVSDTKYVTTEARHWEAVLFDFGEGNLVALDEISVAWDNGGDSDVAILANIGSSGGSGVTLGSDDYASLLSGGDWAVVSRINDVKDAAGDAKTFNTDHAIKSRYWMVAMANEQLGSDTSWGGYDDHAKINYIRGVATAGAPGIPEPATVLLMSLGLLGFRGLRRR